MNLRTLRLSGSSLISSLEPLRSLSKIENLDVSNLRLNDLKDIAYLTNLKMLNIAGTKVVDLRPLAELRSLSNHREP